MPPIRRDRSARALAACRLAAAAAAGLVAAAPARAAGNPAALEWQAVGSFEIARTETTIAQFSRFVAATSHVTLAERQGGGQVYEAGWVRKPGWTWRTPFGGPRAPDPREPAVHVSFEDARAFCRWAGGRLPSDEQWLAAAHTEQRDTPPSPFEKGRRYPYPTGERPDGAQCLGDCGPAGASRAVPHGVRLWRGDGHARAGATPAGVNGLHDMGGNVWEWVDEPAGAGPETERRTRGGSWWYGAAAMRAEHLQSKPPLTAVVYIGFRCVRGG